MAALITITGATGNIGSALAGRLLESGVRVRAVGRSSEKLAPLAAMGADPAVGDLSDAGFLADAFQGASAVFCMIPPRPDAPEIRADQREKAESQIMALKYNAIRRVVVLSSIAGGLPSGTGPIAGLHEFEEMLKKVSGLSVVALRPTYFMENYLASIPLIKNSGINGGPVEADVAVPMIATPDIAAAAAEYLRDPVFEGHAVRDLLGPRDYTNREVTAILGQAIGRPDLPYVEFSYEDFRQGLIAVGISPSVADAYVEMSAAMNDRRIQNTVTRTESSTTPTTFEQFAREVFVPAYQAA